MPRQPIATLALAVSLITHLSAGSGADFPQVESVLGSWKMVYASTPKQTWVLDLKQSSSGLTGTLETASGKRQLKGEFIKGELMLSSTPTGDGEGWGIYTAQLASDQRLVGRLDYYNPLDNGDIMIKRFAWEATRKR